MILTELEHASKHSNGAACVEGSGGSRNQGATRGELDDRGRRVCDETGRPIGRTGGLLRGKEFDVIVLSFSRELGSTGGRIRVTRNGFLLRILSPQGKNAHLVVKD